MASTLYDIARKVGPLGWIIEMHEHYNEHGFFRAEDIGRVLGDSRRGVSMPQNEEEARDYLFSLVE